MKAKLFLVAVLLALVPLSRSMPQNNLEDEYDESEYTDNDEKPAVDETPDYNVPEFISTDQDVRVGLGQRLKLKCQVNKLSGFILIWSRENNNMLKVGPTRLNNDKRINFRDLDNDEGETIVVDMVEAADAGKYECRIASQPSKSIWFTVSVVDPSELTNEVDADAEAEAEAETAAASDGNDEDNAAVRSTGGLGVFVALLIVLFGGRMH